MSLRLDLLDQQLVDADGRPVGRVDDVELDDGTAAVRSLRTGAAALGPRIGAGLGRLLAGAATQLDPRPAPALPVARLTEWTPLLRLDRRLADLTGVAPTERWLAHHVVSRIPGAGDAGL